METSFRSDERFTQRQFAEWLDDYGGCILGHCELIGGEIVMTPPARRAHGALGARLIGTIWNVADRRKLGFVFDSSAGYELPSGDTLQPDVSFVSTARLGGIPKVPTDKLIGIVPDLVVEVLSPSTQRRDRHEKKASYAASGVDEDWIVDEAEREVTVFERSGMDYGPGIAVRSGRVVSRVLPELVLMVEDLFADLD